MKNVINSTIKLKLNKCTTHATHQNLSKYMKFYYWIEIKIWYINVYNLTKKYNT